MYDVIDDPTEKPSGFQLPRTAWSRLNRIRTGHGCCGSCLFKWGLRDSPECDCGVGDQTMWHIVCSCPLRRVSGSMKELSDAKNSRAVDYLSCLDRNL